MFLLTLLDVALALVGAESPMLVPAMKKPLLIVLKVVHDEDEGAGWAAGVAGWP